MLGMVDPDQIQQVLLNLVNNSAQAMKETTSRQIVMGSRCDGKSIFFWVKDTGCGIPAGVASRIFEPFFTTKGEELGNGLGLSISSGIIKEHGGEILLESEEGIGTTMTVRLPIITKMEVNQTQAMENEHERHIIPNQKVLVVDDEESIALLIAEYLQSVGYDPVVCLNGTSALERIMADSFDIIISDVRMPDVDGMTIFSELEKQRPDLTNRFILATGDVTNQEIRHFANNHNLPVIQKPFTKKQVLDVVFDVVSTHEENAQSHAHPPSIHDR